MHRHDTYAIGITLSGVQTFYFKGERWHCLPGQVHILHPDEPHDGGTVADGAFSYRILYVDPALIQNMLPSEPLPFAACPVLNQIPMPRNSAGSIWDADEPIDALGRMDLIATIVDLLLAASQPRSTNAMPLALEGLLRVRDLIGSRPSQRHSLDELERLADLDRWTLARQFRAAFGTSPSRYRTLRQLDDARRRLRSGESLVEASLGAGFADQSHMTRHFKRAYGLTPARWVAALAS